MTCPYFEFLVSPMFYLITLKEGFMTYTSASHQRVFGFTFGELSFVFIYVNDYYC